MKIHINKSFEDNKYKIIALYINISLITNTVAALYSIVFRTEFLYRGILTWVILAIPLLYYFYNILKNKILVSQACVFLVWAGIMILSYFIFKPYDYLFNPTVADGISHVVLPIVLILEVTDYDKFFRAFKPYVFIGAFYCLLQIFIPIKVQGAYYAFSYITLIPALFCLVVGLMQNSKYLVGFVFFLFFGVVFGGRGQLLCFVVAFVLLVYFFHNNKKVLIISISLIIVFVTVFIFSDQLLRILVEVIPSSRIVGFLSGAITDNSRTIVWEALLKEFWNNPFAIHGILSDRIMIGKLLHLHTEVAIAGWYSHNFIVEIIYEFGIVGIVFLLFFFWKVIKCMISLFRRKDNYQIFLFIIFAAYFFGKLSISSSYLIDLATGNFLGILLCFQNKGRLGCMDLER